MYVFGKSPTTPTNSIDDPSVGERSKESAFTGGIKDPVLFFSETVDI